MNLLFLWLCLVAVGSFMGGGNFVEEGDPSSTQDLNSIIPPIFVMNLDRSPQRWARVVEEVEKAGLSVTRLPAVDGKALSFDELRANTTVLSRLLQPRGVIGCYLSHKKFWQLVVDQSLERAIILEDDVRLVDNFKHHLLNHLAQVNSTSDPYDVIMLGAIGNIDPQGHGNVLHQMFTYYMGGARPHRRISDTLYQPQRPAGTHGYMVSLAGAKKLLRLCPKATFHVDLDAWRHHELRIRLFQPMLVYQTFDDSVLTELAPFSAFQTPHASTTVTNPPEQDTHNNTTIQTPSPSMDELADTDAASVSLSNVDDGNDAVHATNQGGPHSTTGSVQLRTTRGRLAGTAQAGLTRAAATVSKYFEDPVSHQPLSHILAEPMLQLGPRGPIVTVHRHLVVMVAGSMSALYLQLLGYRVWAKVVLGGVVSFTLAVRALIWLLMNWK